jgi:hypothetical protein
VLEQVGKGTSSAIIVVAVFGFLNLLANWKRSGSDIRNLLILLVAGEGFEPSSFGL